MCCNFSQQTTGRRRTHLHALRRADIELSERVVAERESSRCAVSWHLPKSIDKSARTHARRLLDISLVLANESGRIERLDDRNGVGLAHGTEEAYSDIGVLESALRERVEDGSKT